MRVESGRGVMGEERDEFPVGMRVLAVDDDPTCLKVLEEMLRQCKYHATTTDRAIKALKMLRENKDKFDLIITDVQMPDMDGFKLLELVGLEMDLPVIMLSAHGDTKVVMKGITHGACDYLLKPVRMEEIKNIWQHVVRKKKSVLREHNHSDNGTSEGGGQGPITSGSSEQKLNRKRKDHNEDEEDDNEENMNENENSAAQKKARVVWSVELHRKFMAAVNHLGINKAVPKRILDLMNVEGITRENVASHLQKYRLYLKKVASHEANLVAALGVRDSYVPLATLDSFGDFHTFTSSSQLPAIQSFQQNGGLSRKEPTAYGHSVSHGMVQVGRIHNASNPINDLSKFQRVTGSQHGSLLQTMPTTLAVDQLQQQKGMLPEANNCFPAGGLGTGSSNNPIVTVTHSPLTLQAHQISSGLPSICSGPFEVNAGVSSNLLDPFRCNENWQTAIPSTVAANALPINSGVSPIVSQINCNPLSFSSSNTLVAPSSHPVSGNTMFMMKGTNDDSKYLNFGSVQNTQRLWMEAKRDQTHEPNILFSSSVNPPLAGQSMVDPTSHSQRLNNGIYSKNVVTHMNGQTNYSALFPPQQCKNDKSIADGQLKYKDECFSTLQGGLSSNGYNFDELVDMIKTEREDALFMDG